MRTRLALGWLALSLWLASPAYAHPVTVDGDPSDWLPRAPASANLGIVARDAMEGGELVWTDAAGDARTDLGDASQVDLTSFAVTADATYLYFRVSVAGTLVTIDPTSAPQIQIAIDLDRTSGSGEVNFAAFGDTLTGEGSRWERLVRTRVAGLIPSVQVLDTSFAAVGTGDLAYSSGLSGAVVEMRVPWTALGRTGPPPLLRLSVATFREDTTTGNTVDIGGSSVSNALDVISDGGDPVASAFPSAWDQELDDMDVDYFLDVWLEADGDVMAPLAITRVLQSATNVEWIEVRNNTSGALDLSGYAVGDEETVDAGEGMFAFPAGAMLAAGATFVAALNGATFRTAYGRDADGEFSSADATTPNMVRLTTWVMASGTVNLANDDEVLVLGPGHTILDVITWAGGTYPGITDLAAAPTNVVAYRDPDTLDTDRGLDFASADDCNVASPCPTRCESCTRFVCVPIPTGSACEDGDPCTSGEVCDASAACGGGSPTSCDDGNGCTADSCDPTSGCVHAPTTGVTCDDASACTSGDSCQSDGSCAGAAITCDDGNVCTADSCDPSSGCASVATPGASCADADLCDGGEVCDASGACVAGTALDCDDGNPCTADACDMTTGCSHTPTPGVSCADADVCDGDEVCDAAGTCAAGTALDCDDGNPCTSDSCAAASGCANDPDEGASCDDGDACTSGESCDASGACGGGAPICDAGAPDPDGGLAEDAGVAEDASVADDASVAEDASVAGDAGQPGRDAGAGGPMRGGCGCRASGGESGGIAFVLAALALLSVRRRARARRGRSG